MNGTHVYIGRKGCGCIRSAALDMRNKATGKRVGEMIADGLTVDRVSDAEFIALGGINAVFADCPHMGKQLDMFEPIAKDAAK